MNLKSDLKPDPGDRPISGAFHPFFYKLVAALAAWFVLSAWGFAGRGATDLALAVVTFVFLAFPPRLGGYDVLISRNDLMMIVRMTSPRKCATTGSAIGQDRRSTCRSGRSCGVLAARRLLRIRRR